MFKQKGITLIKRAFLLIGVFFLSGFILLNSSSRKVSINVDGKELTCLTRVNTVYELLEAQNITVGTRDIVKPFQSELVQDNMTINVIRVKEENIECEEPVKNRMKLIKTPRLHISEQIDLKPGNPGLMKKNKKMFYYDGNLAWEKVINAAILKHAVHGVRLIGTNKKKRMYMMKKPMKVKKTLTMRATAYYPGPEDCAPYDDGYTYLDYKAGYGVCAVDPKVIPLRTKLYVEGYGYALAVDIGSAIKGKKIDVCFDTLKESRKYGVKWVKVHILQ